MITKTSLIAYDMILENLGNRQTQILNAFKKLEFSTSAMVAREINLPINCVTGRCLELRKMFLLERSHISRCAVTKNVAQYWKLKLNNTGGKNGKNRYMGSVRE